MIFILIRRRGLQTWGVPPLQTNFVSYEESTGSPIWKLFIFVMVCQVVLVNLSKVNPTSVNDVPVQDARVVSHNDIFTVADRSFRIEFPHGSPFRVLQPVSIVAQ